jgi:transcriptional antiterminator RfaH
MEECQCVVARTQPHRELWAGENIVRQGADFYLPKYAEFVGHGSDRVCKPRYLFPSYIFVLTRNQWRFLLGTFGISGVVMVGDQPATISMKEIDRLKKREDANGLIVLPQRGKRFKDTQAVHIGSGPFSGRYGIYYGSTKHERERVLMDFLGRKTKLLIGDELLEAVS